MYTMHEALARERMSAARRAAAHDRLCSRLAGERRWRRLEQMAHSAHARHRRAAAQAASSSVGNWAS
jgi:hypothetical protein